MLNKPTNQDIIFWSNVSRFEGFHCCLMVVYFVQVTEAVTKRKHDQFLVWYNRWSDENVSDEDRQSCRNWFLGQSDEQQQPETHTIPED